MKRFASCMLVVVLSGWLAAAGETANFRPIGTMGKGANALKGGKEAVLYEHQGKGCLTHFWFGGKFKGVEDTRIRYYVDGETVPSIDMNLYMGHGIGFGDNQAPWANRHMGKIGKGNGIFNNYKIPFEKSIKVTAQRAVDAEDNPRVWWIIHGVENGRVRVGGVDLPANAKLKLVKQEDLVVDSLKEFNLCDLAGTGAVYQVFIAAKGLGNPGDISFLEACMRVYPDGVKDPVFLSSGLEDYFLGTYYFDSGRYYTDTAGLTHFNQAKSSFSAYRFHDDDPLLFSNGIRVTCRNGETKDGAMKGPRWAGGPQQVRYTTYTWIYQW